MDQLRFVNQFDCIRLILIKDVRHDATHDTDLSKNSVQAVNLEEFKSQVLQER